MLHFNSVIDLQLKEIGGRSKPSDSLKSTEQPAEKKKGLADWMNLMKPGSEEKDHWVMLKFFPQPFTSMQQAKLSCLLPDVETINKHMRFLFFLCSNSAMF